MNYQRPCWDSAQVTRTVMPDAEEIEDHLFRAIHSPTLLQMSYTVDSHTTSVTADKFAMEFMDPNRSYVQAVVLGESGTGKSHLIQWLRLNIPNDVNTVKLTIPKTGTSLRGIVERLIRELPENEQQQFTRRLGETGSQLVNQSAKVDLFLNALAWSIGHNSKCTDDIDEGLQQLLPAIFLDTQLRAVYYRKSGGTVDQIVKHIFEPPDERGPESIRQFSETDLPLKGNLYEKVAGPTKDAIDFINAEIGIMPKAIEMMNGCLESAISQTLNFSADNLIELMSSLRRHLAKQGKRLILLIEDFARLQGIDSALLQALITPPKQGEDRLCEIRWAMAVTTGYFQRLDATVRTRANIVIDMDLSVPASINEMTANYLNAVRVGEEKLLETSATDPIPNACNGCRVRESCISAFGEINNIGLYPFNREAIAIFSERSGAVANDRFNPRKYLSAVIIPVMEKHYSEIERGEFPSTALLNMLGGARTITPANRSLITQSDGDELGERRIALLELWEGSGNLVNLPEKLQEAFGIPKLKNASNAKISDSAPDGIAKGSIKQTPKLAIPHISELQTWESAKLVLPSTTVTPLRELVFETLESYIDWDALGFKKSDIVTGSGGGSIAFKKTSINFHGQQTQLGIALVTLTLPLEPKSTKDWRDTALALQALVMFSRNRNWDFEDAPVMLPILMEMLEKWAHFVQREIRQLYSSTKNWDPAIAAAELLALGIHQSGKNAIDTKVDGLILKVWEQKEPEVMGCLSPNFLQINKKILQNWPKLQGTLRLFCSGTKGGQAGNYVNPVAVTRAVRLLRQRSLKLSQEPPLESKISTLKTIADIYREVKERYLVDLETERTAWMQWRDSLDVKLGGENTFAQFLNELRDSITQCENAGLTSGGVLLQLKLALAEINQGTAERARVGLKTLESENATDALLRFSISSRSHKSIDEIISKADSFLTNANSAVKNRLAEEHQRVGPGLAQSNEAIRIALADLVDASNNIQLAIKGKT
jgi:hypothetical protein